MHPHRDRESSHRSRYVDGELHADVDLVEILGQIIFVGQADPKDVVRLKIHIQFNELTVNAIEHNTIVALIHHRVYESAVVPHKVRAVGKGESVEFSFIHMRSVFVKRKNSFPLSATAGKCFS